MKTMRVHTEESTVFRTLPSGSARFRIASCVFVAAMLALLLSACSNAGADNGSAGKQKAATTPSGDNAEMAVSKNATDSHTNKKKASLAVEHVTAIMQNLKALHNNIEDYAGLTTEKGIKAGVFPKSMVDEASGTVTNVWGGDVALKYSPGQDIYLLGYAGVPKDACYKMAASVGIPVTSVAVNLQRMNANASRQSIEGKCSNPGSGASGGNLFFWGGGRYR